MGPPCRLESEFEPTPWGMGPQQLMPLLHLTGASLCQSFPGLSSCSVGMAQYDMKEVAPCKKLCFEMTNSRKMQTKMGLHILYRPPRKGPWTND